MSALKAAILRAQQPGGSCPHTTSDANPTQAWQALITAAPGTRQPNSTQQLTALRRQFDACITRSTRFADELDIKRWGGPAGSMRRRRQPRPVKPKQHLSTSDGTISSNSVETSSTARCHEDSPSGWPSGLDADLRAVALEAGLAAHVVASVLRAAHRGTITSNPGVLLCQLLRFQAGLEGLLGRRQVMAALHSHPALLNASPELLTWHMEELQEIFGAATAAAMVAKQPLLLCACPFTVWSNLEALRSMLGARLERATHMAARQPRLLLNSPSALRGRLCDLEDLTQLPTRVLQGLILSQPALLTYHPATLAHNLERMAQLLDISQEQAGRLLVKAPALLMLHQDTLTNKLQGLAGVLQCSQEEAVSLVLRQPSLLSISTQLLADKWRQLPGLLGASDQDMAAIVASQPALLTVSPATLQRKLHALQATLLAVGTESDVAASHHAPQQQQQGQQQQGQQPSLQQEVDAHKEAHSLLLAPAPEMEPAAEVGADTMDCQHLQPSSQHGTHCLRSQGVASEAHPATMQQQGEAGSPEAGLPQGCPHEPGGTYADAQPGQQLSPSKSIQHSVCPSAVGSLMGRAWQQQLQVAAPRAKATYACFSEQRYARLAALSAAVQGQLAPGVAQAACTAVQQAAGKQWALSRVLRVSDDKFRKLLQGVQAQLCRMGA